MSSNSWMLHNLLVVLTTLAFLCLGHLRKTTGSPQYVPLAKNRGQLQEELRDIIPTPRPRKIRQRIGSVSKSTNQAFLTSLDQGCGTASQDQQLHLDSLHNVELGNKFI